MSEESTPMSTKLFLYMLTAFNFLFLTYVLTVGYYNRFALDDYVYLGVLRDYGFFNPFTYWYFNWQGRFAPQFFLNTMYLICNAISSLLFYPLLLASLFIYAIYQILKVYFSFSRLVLLNYSILLFSALFLATLEVNTFYWMNASVMYFGGILFALLGIAFIVKEKNSFLYYAIIALCFLYTGSSSEHFGALASFILFLFCWYTLYRSGYNFRSYRSVPLNKKLLTALFFCLIAFIIMILSPGTAVRMSQTLHVTDPVDILRKSFDSTMFICAHIFYKLPYIIVYIPLFLLFGTFLKFGKIKFKINFFFYILLLCGAAMGSLIFVSNLPVAYALGTVGPLRSYVFVTFFLVTILFLLCIYTGFRYQSRLKGIGNLSIISLVMLFGFVFYTFYSELPLLKRYNQSDRQRIAILKEHQEQKRTEPVFLPPLYNPEYNTISDMWRTLTKTNSLPSVISDMPVFIGEIGETPDWRNGHLKFGLALEFDVYLAPPDSIISK